jgi:hypothetical protein
VASVITEHDLAEAIAECEGQRNPTANTCLKLAAFYTIRNNMFPKEQEPNFYSMQSKPMVNDKVEYESEFSQAIAGMDINEIIPIMDELMTTLKVLVPKLYDGVMRKLSSDY